ncbi:hypothetical protein [Algicola sagamiensis]|uniref:hypothetical protein n=1 Tax=Algicola sagamiensis TaxID=163869 RepID=UPI000371A0CA|nr:hypothetical protein [Algicola sagamiensis]
MQMQQPNNFVSKTDKEYKPKNFPSSDILRFSDSFREKHLSKNIQDGNAKSVNRIDLDIRNGTNPTESTVIIAKDENEEKALLKSMWDNFHSPVGYKNEGNNVWSTKFVTVSYTGLIKEEDNGSNEIEYITKEYTLVKFQAGVTTGGRKEEYGEVSHLHRIYGGQAANSNSHITSYNKDTRKKTKNFEKNFKPFRFQAY